MKTKPIIILLICIAMAGAGCGSNVVLNTPKGNLPISNHHADAIDAWIRSMPAQYCRPRELGPKPFFKVTNWERAGRKLDGASEYIISRLNQEQSYSEKRKLIIALGILGDNNSVDELINIMTEKVEVDDSLGKVKALEERVRIHNCKMQAKEGLFEIKSDYLLLRLHDVLNSDDVCAKLDACDILKHVGGDKAISSLELAAKDSSGKVKTKAENILQQITP